MKRNKFSLSAAASALLMMAALVSAMAFLSWVENTTLF